MNKALWLLLITASLLNAQPDSFRVDGDSMYPTIVPGSRITTDNKIRLKDLKSGDIIVFIANNDYVVHRFFWENNTWYTKGDNNPRRDVKFVNEKTLVGRVVSIY
ncbi:MAG: signal peptidase I [Proteobacteria bacterium]|nr:signal peptidase I [Pseudomonadota bacterium]NBP13047.1 signal peptidase I [bacterium]